MLALQCMPLQRATHQKHSVGFDVSQSNYAPALLALSISRNSDFSDTECMSLEECTWIISLLRSTIAIRNRLYAHLVRRSWHEPEQTQNSDAAAGVIAADAAAAVAASAGCRGAVLAPWQLVLHPMSSVGLVNPILEPASSRMRH